jgi:hypothetical protein
VDAALAIEHPAAPRRRRLIWFVIMASFVGLLTLVSFEGFVQGSKIVGLSGEAVAPIVPTPPSVVCREAISSSCAHTAADISGMPSAWIQAPVGFRLAEFFASNAASGTARSQVLFLPEQGGTSQISLDSADNLQPRLASSQTVTAGSNSGILSQLNVAGSVVEAQLLWTHGGHTYSLLWIGSQVDPKALIAAWNHVKYAYPSQH